MDIRDGRAHAVTADHTAQAHRLHHAGDCSAHHRGNGQHLKDYCWYAEAILAAADGEVVAVHDGHHESPFIGYFMPDFLATQIAGNHVIIRHGEGEYGFHAHLIPGTVPVEVGDTVNQGDLIGRCKYSRNSTS
ncbi:MAG: M23 family metallopeptidase [Candidatus Delongbacteria bacterium]|nr:M23 family metallopeptidase [Candidatus Delongbacteria bacterium]